MIFIRWLGLFRSLKIQRYGFSDKGKIFTEAIKQIKQMASFSSSALNQRNGIPVPRMRNDLSRPFCWEGVREGEKRLCRKFIAIFGWQQQHQPWTNTFSQEFCPSELKSILKAAASLKIVLKQSLYGIVSS